MGFGKQIVRLAPVFVLAACAGGQGVPRAGLSGADDISLSCTDRSEPPVTRSATMDAGTAQMFGSRLRAKDDTKTTTVNGEDNQACEGRSARPMDVSCMVGNERLRGVNGATQFAIHAPSKPDGASYLTFTGGDVTAYRGEVTVEPLGKDGQKMMTLGTKGESVYCTWAPSK